MVLSFPIYGHIAKSTYVFISILLISFEFQRGVGDPPNTLFTLFRAITCFSSPLNSRKRQWTENEKCLWYEASQGIWIEGSGASSQSQSILSGEHSDSVLPLLANQQSEKALQAKKWSSGTGKEFTFLPYESPFSAAKIVAVFLFALIQEWYFLPQGQDG